MTNDRPPLGNPTVIELTPIRIPAGVRAAFHSDPAVAWIKISLDSGLALTAVPETQLLSAERGKVAIENINVGEHVVTETGLAPVVNVEKLNFADFAIRARIDRRGGVFWADEILVLSE